MTRLIAGTILAAAVLLIIYASTVRADRHPLLITAAAPIAAPNLLFAPCPLAPQNIPPRIKEHDA